ncbi:uncharacterized protein AMSG_00880 [Thecamonas trahens ATCC 50062]|uniref:Protein-PII uridylyltransferase N-terminal domain-containing protein n=1 Tax=Thecamonas trahens ATCC 50062 TaxID=461836 RepID=A0A0L0DL04_THETB|nr:hypothetical protein AMSG_00880 [Thecamonas trahens ATCC 50062]KNC52053.1 hypothetical protein AMSG_00880 [Thecamonas trahens ATCC 50062]|eukprot:XP_013762059.1 hypothetical protein AMSG_00880 [Thecamonas trahens ATCC 50062]
MQSDKPCPSSDDISNAVNCLRSAVSAGEVAPADVTSLMPLLLAYDKRRSPTPPWALSINLCIDVLVSARNAPPHQLIAFLAELFVDAGELMTAALLYASLPLVALSASTADLASPMNMLGLGEDGLRETFDRLVIIASTVARVYGPDDPAVGDLVHTANVLGRASLQQLPPVESASLAMGCVADTLQRMLARVKAEAAERAEPLSPRLTALFHHVIHLLVLPLLPTPPLEYALLGLGSMARSELSASSDIDCMVLVASKPTADEASWLNIFATLIELCMVAFGETQAHIGPYAVLSRPAGFHLDEALLSPRHMQLTVTQAIERQRAELRRLATEPNADIDPIAGALRNACFVAGSRTLYGDYIDRLAELFASPSQELGLYSLSRNCSKTHGVFAPQTSTGAFSGTAHLKPLILRPISLLADGCMLALAPHDAARILFTVDRLDCLSGPTLEAFPPPVARALAVIFEQAMALRDAYAPSFATMQALAHDAAQLLGPIAAGIDALCTSQLPPRMAAKDALGNPLLHEEALLRLALDSFSAVRVSPAVRDDPEFEGQRAAVASGLGDGACFAGIEPQSVRLLSPEAVAALDATPAAVFALPRASIFWRNAQLEAVLEPAVSPLATRTYHAIHALGALALGPPTGRISDIAFAGSSPAATSVYIVIRGQLQEYRLRLRRASAVPLTEALTATSSTVLERVTNLPHVAHAVLLSLFAGLAHCGPDAYEIDESGLLYVGGPEPAPFNSSASLASILLASRAVLESTVPQAVHARLAALAPRAVVEAWMSAACRDNDDLVRPAYLSVLLNRLYAAKTVAASRDVGTLALGDLAGAIDARLVDRYRARIASERGHTPLKVFRKVAKSLSEPTTPSVSASTASLAQIWSSMTSTSSAQADDETDTPDARLRALAALKVDAWIETFLEHFPWASAQLEVQVSLLNVLPQLRLRRLVLSGCTAVTSTRLSTIMAASRGSLVDLDVSGCTALDSLLWMTSKRRNWALARVNLAGCTLLGGGDVAALEAAAPHLAWLQLSSDMDLCGTYYEVTAGSPSLVRQAVRPQIRIALDALVRPEPTPRFVTASTLAICRADFSKAGLHDEFGVALARVLLDKRAPHVTDVSVAGNELTAVGVLALVNAFASADDQSRLVSVTVADNAFDVDGDADLRMLLLRMSSSLRMSGRVLDYGVQPASRAVFFGDSGMDVSMVADAAINPSGDRLAWLAHPGVWVATIREDDDGYGIQIPIWTRVVCRDVCAVEWLSDDVLVLGTSGGAVGTARLDGHDPAFGCIHAGDAVTSMAVLPGERVLVGRASGVLHEVELSEVAYEAESLVLHSSPIHALAILPDSRVATASFDGVVGLWLRAGAGWVLLDHWRAPTGSEIGPMVATAAGELLVALAHPTQLLAVAFEGSKPAARVVWEVDDGAEGLCVVTHLTPWAGRCVSRDGLTRVVELDDETTNVRRAPGLLCPVRSAVRWYWLVWDCDVFGVVADGSLPRPHRQFDLCELQRSV